MASEIGAVSARSAAVGNCFITGLCWLAERVVAAIRGVFEWFVNCFASAPSKIEAVQVAPPVQGPAEQVAQRVLHNGQPPAQPPVAAAPPVLMRPPAEAPAPAAAPRRAPPPAIVPAPAPPPVLALPPVPPGTLRELLEGGEAFSPVEREALEFALRLLDANRGIESRFAFGRILPAREIRQLDELCILQDEVFRNIIWPHREEPNPWIHPEVVAALDSLMKLRHATGILMLRELPQVLHYHGLAALNQILVDENTHYYKRILDNLGYTYSQVRMLYLIEATMGMKTILPPLTNHLPPPDYVRLFYTPGTRQSEWRALHNDFYNRMRATGINLPARLRKELDPDTDPLMKPAWRRV